MTPISPRLLLWSAAALLLIGRATDSQQRFTSRTVGVRVDVLVSDGSRRVRGLTADDFELGDDGVAQHISQIDVEHIPLNLVCVFDTSSSVAGTRLQELVDAGRALVDQLREADRVAVLSFATHVSLQAPLTSDRNRISRALADMHANGMTSLRDATFTGLALRDTDPGRTLLLLFSDGDDTSSWLDAASVVEAAKRTDVVVYPVLAPAAPTPPSMTSVRDIRSESLRRRMPIVIVPPVQASDQRAKFLETIAAETGGQVTRIKADREMKGAFTAILGEFRDRYVLTYVPTGVSPSGWHQLTIRVKGKGAKVMARRGYFAD